ncbi:hypothetical protein ABT025_24210 [Streptomyces sp. NPDC002809]|uniref:hypothetical protein n=1 Tax=Streptomyces sp. NPDC002809 TaxID=3154433 RepID=UPI0033300C6A
MGALVLTDLNLGGDRAARFLGPDGLGEQWLDEAPHMQPTVGPRHLPRPDPPTLRLRRRMRGDGMTARA